MDLAEANVRERGGDGAVIRGARLGGEARGRRGRLIEDGEAHKVTRFDQLNFGLLQSIYGNHNRYSWVLPIGLRLLHPVLGEAVPR